MFIYLVGASNPETIRVTRAVERNTPNIKFVGMIDNDVEKQGKEFYGIPILGGVDIVKSLIDDNVYFVNLITGSTRARHFITSQILSYGGRLANLIHPNLDLTLSKIGLGLYLQEGVIIQAGVEVGDNTSLHMGALIGHESIIGKSVFIAHAVSVSGCCEIGDGVFIGTNASILPRLKVGKWSTVGAGAVVTKDVPEYAVVVGNPAKIIGYNEREIND
jgi:sugar O-acyltransferase (sialic acid O-acetyltransferase NeuD family)